MWSREESAKFGGGGFSRPGEENYFSARRRWRARSQMFEGHAEQGGVRFVEKNA